MQQHVMVRQIRDFPRLPLEGNLDVTYRCNNNCRHCWLRIPPDSPEKKQELSLGEIKSIVDEARAMGCRRWAISGGEPMLRADFADIFEYITAKSATYSINTNGTLITPAIARLLKKKGSKMVALYGATAEVHDHITRNHGSFEATMRGFAYLKEAEAGFTAQLIPMRDNYHQFEEMKALAESLSPHWRIGAPWLFFSASGDPGKNREIRHQRLDPATVVELDTPDVSHEDRIENALCRDNCSNENDDRLFAACISKRREFHIDPYGHMTFCSFIKDSRLRYDLRKGNFKECWEDFIPSLAETVRGGSEYLKNCAACHLQSECRWCPVYGYLEHRQYSAKVDYLCSVARENKTYKENWKNKHRRFYRIGGITIRVDSDLEIKDNTFQPKFKLFQVDGPGEDTISIRHHFFLPDLNGKKLGHEVYRKPPWTIYRNGNSWVYLGISPTMGEKHVHRVAIFSHDHTRARIYNEKEEIFHKGSLGSVSFFSTDQVLLARVLADRAGCYMHSAGLIMEGKGLLFAGHSDAGKSTMATMLKDKAEILCDDRMIVRRWPEGFRIHGTWSHGDVPKVSPNDAPLEAIFFLVQANKNQIHPIRDKEEIIRNILSCLVRPLATGDWWNKMLSLVGQILLEVPFYYLYFDQSGKVADVIADRFNC